MIRAGRKAQAVLGAVADIWCLEGEFWPSTALPLLLSICPLADEAFDVSNVSCVPILFITVCRHALLSRIPRPCGLI